MPPGIQMMFLLSRNDDGGDARAALRRFGPETTVVAHKEFDADSRMVSALIADLAPAKGGA